MVRTEEQRIADLQKAFPQCFTAKELMEGVVVGRYAHAKAKVKGTQRRPTPRKGGGRGAIYTTHEAAEAVGCSTKRLDDLVALGVLHPLMAGSHRVYNGAQVEMLVSFEWFSKEANAVRARLGAYHP